MDATQGCANMMVKGSVNLPCLLNQKGPGKVNCDPDMLISTLLLIVYLTMPYRHKDATCTVLVLRMAHRIWKESKQQSGTAGPGNMLGSSLVGHPEHEYTV